MLISHLDHLVLTVRDIEKSCSFYTKVLGMEVVIFGDNRTALNFGKQKINLHNADKPLTPHANNPVPGSADLCLITQSSLQQVIQHLHSVNVAIELGPVMRTGTCGAIESIYFRDPDGNLIEVGHYDA